MLKGKFWFALPVLFVLIMALFLLHSTQSIEEAMVNEKLIEITDAINMIAQGMEQPTRLNATDREAILCKQIEYLDALYQIYASVFAWRDGNLTRISERYYETSPFEPFEWPELIEAVTSYSYGTVVINYAPQDQNNRDLHLYYKWVPGIVSDDERLLIMGGVSKHSIVTKIPVISSIPQWGSLAVVLLLVFYMIRNDYLLGKERAG